MAIFVYMLRCADGAYYIGSHRGEDVAHRVADHNAGRFPKAWTYRRRPVELVWAEYVEHALDATAVERQLKGWTRAKKEALIRGDWGHDPGPGARGDASSFDRLRMRRRRAAAP